MPALDPFYGDMISTVENTARNEYLDIVRLSNI